MALVIAAGYGAGSFAQAGRRDLAVCAVLVALLVSASWIFGDAPEHDDVFARLVRRLLGWGRR